MCFLGWSILQNSFHIQIVTCIYFWQKIHFPLLQHLLRTVLGHHRLSCKSFPCLLVIQECLRLNRSSVLVPSIVPVHCDWYDRERPMPLNEEFKHRFYVTDRKERHPPWRLRSIFCDYSYCLDSQCFHFKPVKALKSEWSIKETLIGRLQWAVG